MYPKPHDKFCDRTYSYNPTVGIPLALETLNNPESHRDDVMAATCYLGYRLLDKSFTDVDYVWEKLGVAREIAKTSMLEDPAWIRTRWQVSLALIYAYVDVVIRNNPLPREVLLECVTEEHVTNHPLQTVNVMRAQLLLAADELFRIGKVDRIVCQDLIEKYSLRAVNLFRLASEKFSLVTGRESNYIYCFSESMECMNEIVKFKYCYNLETLAPIEKIIEDLRLLLVDPTKAQYRQTLVTMYENRKAYEKKKIIPKMNFILDICDKKAAFATTAKCGSRTVVGWSAILKTPSIYESKPELFASNRSDTYTPLRQLVYPFENVDNILKSEIFFTVVRNPVDRFISAYVNRVLFLKKIPFISVSDLIENYDQYITDPKFGDIKLHTRPLSFFCGKDPTVFTHIFNVTQMGELKSLLEKTYKITLPDIVLHKTDMEKPVLTQKQVHKLQRIYKEDYDIYGKWLD